MRNRLAKLGADIEASRPKLVAAEAQMSHWFEARAAVAERYAAAARDVAVAALNGAHQAALEACLAFKDASSARRH